MHRIVSKARAEALKREVKIPPIQVFKESKKSLVYSSWGPSQEESSTYLGLSNPADKDITKIMAGAGAIQIENRKEHTILLMLSLLLKI